MTDSKESVLQQHGASNSHQGGNAKTAPQLQSISAAAAAAAAAATAACYSGRFSPATTYRTSAAAESMRRCMTNSQVNRHYLFISIDSEKKMSSMSRSADSHPGGISFFELIQWPNVNRLDEDPFSPNCSAVKSYSRPKRHLSIKMGRQNRMSKLMMAVVTINGGRTFELPLPTTGRPLIFHFQTLSLSLANSLCALIIPLRWVSLNNCPASP